jgi:hypothetical protein
MGELMTVFRLHLLPDATDPAQVLDFCVAQRVIGCGYRLAPRGTSDRIDDGSGDLDKIRAAGEEYREARDPSRRVKWWRGFKSAFTSFSKKIQEGDFCWTHAQDGNYRLARVKQGGLAYRTGNPWDENDIHLTRPADWVEASIPPDQVPGFIRRQFAQGGRTIQRVHHLAAHEISENIFSHLREGTPPRRIANIELWDLLGPDEAEDMVCFYLQLRHGWITQISTAKLSNPLYECEFRNLEGRRAAVQVKTGGASFDINSLPEGFDHFYVFNANGYSKPNTENITYIARNEMQEFARQHANLVPPMIRPYVL